MHSKKLVLVRRQGKILTALLEDGKTLELHLDDEKQDSILGNVYIGKVRKLVPNIQAAFVEIANHVQCYYSLSENKAPFFTKKGNSPRLAVGDELLVQVSRENLKSKPPALTANINLTGRFAVLTMGSREIGVSSKLPAEKKQLLRTWIAPFASPDYGFIVRTNAGDISREVFEAEVRQLVSQRDKLLAEAPYRTAFSLLCRNNPVPWLTPLRDTCRENLEEIITDDAEIFTELRGYLSGYQREDLEKLRFYEDPLLPLSKLYSLESALEDALRERVWLKSGGYLVIQPTEALTVIDVNTGKFDGHKKREETFLKINLEAAREIAGQLRLRNLSGIIIIDFINMETEENRQVLMETLGAELRRDPLKTTLVDMTALGLVEVTRKKVRQPLYEQIKGEKRV